MNRLSWFLFLFSLFLAAVATGAGTIGRFQGADTGELYVLASVLALAGLGLFFAVRGVAWIISGFWDD
jgi:hypothetical protein